MNIKEVLVYLMKRELTTKELEAVVKELQTIIYARDNVPF